MKNAYLHVTLEQSTWNVSPTHFQASSFPEHWRKQISVIHDGVDMARAVPNPSPAPMTLPDGTLLEGGQPIVTFVNRRLEPYRGCHTFIRALPVFRSDVPTPGSLLSVTPLVSATEQLALMVSGVIVSWRRLRGNTTRRGCISPENCLTAHSFHFSS